MDSTPVAPAGRPVEAEPSRGAPGNEATKATWHPSDLLPAAVRRHPGVCAATLFAAVAAFWNLGGPLLWNDEAETAILGGTILEYGLPKVWDGVAYVDQDFGRRTNGALVQVGYPWVPYYAAAAGILICGDDAFGARAPFALAAVLAVPVLYVALLRFAEDRRAAVVSAWLLVLGVQYVLYARQSRYYAPAMLFGCLTLAAFPRLTAPRGRAWFVLWSVLLFHCHPLAAAGLLVASGLAVLGDPVFRDLRRPFWTAAPAIWILTLPWIALGWEGWKMFSEGDGTPPPPAWNTAVQYLFELSALFPWLGAVVLLGWCAARGTLSGPDRAFLRLAATVVVVVGLLSVRLYRPYGLWDLGLRHMVVLIPLSAAVSGLLIARATFGAPAPLGAPVPGGRPHRRAAAACVALVALVSFTHLADNALPWTFQSSGWFPPREAKLQARMHVPKTTLDKLVRREWYGMLKELDRPPRGTMSEVVGFLQQHAAPGDVVVANYEWSTLYHATRLPLGAVLQPDFAGYEAARRHGLPEYVFSPTEARWIVWRPAWADFGRTPLLSAIHAELKAAGKTWRPVKLGTDTITESRENLHFHRFPALGCLYVSHAEAYPEPPRYWIERVE